MTSSKALQTFASIGVDIGKEIFHIVGFSLDGKIILRKKVKRLALEKEFEKLAPSIVGMDPLTIKNDATTEYPTSSAVRSRHTDDSTPCGMDRSREIEGYELPGCTPSSTSASGQL
jgi:hypothetical protein